MLKIKRATEYALISMSYMSQRGGDKPATAREICEQFGLPFELTAKTLQKLKATGMIRSIQGVQGGYVLTQPLSAIRLGDFLRVMEGEKGLVDCCHQGVDPDRAPGCELFQRCGIRPFMSNLNHRVFNFLSTVTLAEINPGEMKSQSHPQKINNAGNL